MLLILLPACAQGIDFDESWNAGFDGGRGLDASGLGHDTGLATADIDSGSIGMQDDGSASAQPGGPGGGLDAASGLDAGTGAGRDAAADTATPGRMDAAPDTNTPSTPDTSTPSTPDTSTPSTPDTSTPSTPDTGPSTPDVGPGPDPLTCAATPAYATTTACARCTCMRCAQQVSTCFASNESAKNTQCAAVQTCAEANKCVDRDCYCGKDTSDLACLSNQSGACVQVIERAAGSDSPLEVQRAGDDPQSPVGRAALIGACQLANCRSDCGL